MKKWRVVTGEGVKAKRTFCEFISFDDALKFSLSRNAKLPQEYEVKWTVKIDRGTLSPEMIGTFDDLKKAREAVAGQSSKYVRIQSIESEIQNLPNLPSIPSIP